MSKSKCYQSKENTWNPRNALSRFYLIFIFVELFSASKSWTLQQARQENKICNIYSTYANIRVRTKNQLLGAIISRNNPNDNSYHALNHVQIKCKLINKCSFLFFAFWPSQQDWIFMLWFQPQKWKYKEY